MTRLLGWHAAGAITVLQPSGCLHGSLAWGGLGVANTASLLLIATHSPCCVPSAGQLEAARALLEKGASTEKACEGSPPLHVAVAVASLPARRPFAQAAVELLLQFGADPYERCAAGRLVGCQSTYLEQCHASVSCCHQAAL